MTYDQHVILSCIGIIFGIIGYIPYYRDTIRGTTKPHLFTWLGFSLLNGTTFIAQVAAGGGPGAWITAITTLATLGVTVIAFTRGDKDILLFDWICFGGAIVGMVLWWLTHNPLWAVIIVTIADLLAFAPTFRKGFLRPHEETTLLYIMSVCKYGISIFALSTRTATTALFPIAIALANMSIAVMLTIRRKQIHPRPSTTAV